MHPGNNAPHTSGTLHRGLGVSAGALSAPRASDCATPRIDGSPGLDLHSIQSRCGSGLGAGYGRKTLVNGPAPQIRSRMRRGTCYIRHTSIPQSLPKRSPTPLATAAAPTAGSAPPAGTDRPCSGSVRVPDDRVLIRRGRSGQALSLAAEVICLGAVHVVPSPEVMSLTWLFVTPENLAAPFAQPALF